MDEGLIKGEKVCHHTEGRVILFRSFNSAKKSVLVNNYEYSPQDSLHHLHRK